MKYIDSILDRITMYKLLLYYLLTILAAALVFSSIGSLAYSPVAITLSAGFFVLVCWLVNAVFAWAYKAPSNPESSILTGLILALIITPTPSMHGLIFFAAAGGLAIASKYILAINNKHIFNPAAIAVVLTAFGPQQSASWWVGSTVLLPFVVIGGLLVVRKIRRLRMVSAFFVIALATTSLLALLGHKDVGATVQATLLHSSLFFLGFAMLTEPLTSPSRWANQRWYILLVGVFFAPQLHIGGLYTTPELALVIGNLASFLMTPRVKTLLRLRERLMWGRVTEDFIFVPEKKFNYQPGQYVELTLPHAETDSRGSRRYFTLASSPTEATLQIGIRFYDKGSSFKKALRAASELTAISAGQLGGEFTLSKDPHQKLAFIAGGIGVTPFRSMVKYLDDTDDPRPVTLLYGERTVQDIAYSDVFEAARQHVGTKIIYVINDENAPTSSKVRQGTITPELIQTELPDYSERLFYVSGPPTMVRAIKKMLLGLGVARKNIKVDFFSGYA